MLNRDMPEGGRLTKRLRSFGTLVADDSPLYGRICSELAEDEVVLEILSNAAYDQPAPNILLGAVHYLLLEGTVSALAAHYPSVVGDSAATTGDPVELFAAFCLDHRERLIQIVSTRTVQTNEVRRCTALMPAFAAVLQHANKPLALVEIGASAGLNLGFDRYHYDYGSGITAGPLGATLRLSTELRAGTLPPIDPLPKVAWRRGIDLHPVDLNNPDSVRWARALLWPEQLDRIERFDTAVAIAREAAPDVVEGDALNLLPEIALSAPDDAALVIVHSFVIYQFSDEDRYRLDAVIADISSTREVHRIGMEMLTGDRQPPPIEYTRYTTGHSENQTLGRANHHGSWLEWGT